MKIEELIESTQSSKPIVYVDMDGVLADLFNHAAELRDVDSYHHMSNEDWDNFLKESDAYHLFRELPTFPTTNKLIDIVKKYAGSYRILSSPLAYDRAGSIKGKKEWLKKHIHDKPEQEIFEHEKYIYAKQKDGTPNILIDDYGVNTRAWTAHGGIAIKYQADEDSLDKVDTGLAKVFGKDK